MQKIQWTNQNSKQTNAVLIDTEKSGKTYMYSTLYACQVSNIWIGLICFSFVLDDQVLQVVQYNLLAW